MRALCKEIQRRFVFGFCVLIHTPSSYSKLITEIKNQNIINKNKYRIIIKCIDYQRLQYQQTPTLNTYIDQCVSVIINDFHSIKRNNKLIYFIAHSMGSRICQTVLNNLIKFRKLNMKSIGGVIHIAGTVLKNGENYNKLHAKQNELNSKNKTKLKLIGNNNEWIKFMDHKDIKKDFLNDINDENYIESIKLFNTLEPEIISNIIICHHRLFLMIKLLILIILILYTFKHCWIIVFILNYNKKCVMILIYQKKIGS